MLPSVPEAECHIKQRPTLSVRTVYWKPSVPFVVLVTCRHVYGQDHGIGRQGAPLGGEDGSV